MERLQGQYLHGVETDDTSSNHQKDPYNLNEDDNQYGRQMVYSTSRDRHSLIVVCESDIDFKSSVCLKIY